MDVGCCDRESTAPVKPPLEKLKQTDEIAALYKHLIAETEVIRSANGQFQRSDALYKHLIAETEVIRSANGQEQSPIREAIVNGFYVAKHGASVRRSKIAVIAQKEQEGLSETLLDDAAVGSAINIDSRFASGIVMAKLQRRRAAKGMPEHSEPPHVQPSSEPARWIDRIEPLQLIHHKLCIAAPHGQYFANQADLVKRWQNFRIRRARSEDYSSIREDDNHGSVRRIEAYDNVPRSEER